MSDALTTEPVLDAASTNGQPQPANGEAQAETPKQKVNLHELPEFRELQSKRDKREAELQRTIEAERQERLRLQRQFEEFQDRAAPDDYTRLELQLRRSQEKLAAYEQQMRAVQSEREAADARDKALREIADEFGVPRAELDDATDYKHATKLAVAYLTGQKQRKAQEDEERREANRPDIGGGKTSTPSSRFDREYEDAMRRKDSVAIMRLNREYARLAREK